MRATPDVSDQHAQVQCLSTDAALALRVEVDTVILHTVRVALERDHAGCGHVAQKHAQCTHGRLM